MMTLSLEWFDLGVGTFYGLLAWAAWKHRRSRLNLLHCLLVGLIILFPILAARRNLVVRPCTSGPHSSFCQANLSVIHGAKEAWALDYTKTATDIPQPSDLFGETSYVRTEPTCPAGGVYRLGPVQDKPQCSLGAGDPNHRWKDWSAERAQPEPRPQPWAGIGIGFAVTLALALLSASLLRLSPRRQGASRSA